MFCWHGLSHRCRDSPDTMVMQEPRAARLMEKAMLVTLCSAYFVCKTTGQVQNVDLSTQMRKFTDTWCVGQLASASIFLHPCGHTWRVEKWWRSLRQSSPCLSVAVVAVWIQVPIIRFWLIIHDLQWALTSAFVCYLCMDDCMYACMHVCRWLQMYICILHAEAC